MSTPDIVESRPKTVNWWYCVGFIALLATFTIGIGTDASSAPKDKLLMLSIAWGFFGPCVLLMVIALRCSYVRVDRDGITWSTFLKPQHATWQQVQEYYRLTNQGRSFEIIQTTVGKVTLLESGTNLPALRAAIQERALWASTREWGLRGAQLTLENQTFTYGREIQVMFYLSLLCSLGCGPLLSWGQNPILTVQKNLAIMPWWVAIGSLFVLLFIWLLTGGLMLLLWTPVYLAVRARDGESIRVSEAGIEWRRNHTVISARWDEVEAIRKITFPGPIKISGIREVQTRYGTFSYVIAGVKQGVILDDLVRKRVQPQLTEPESDVMAGTHEVLPGGALRFTYRTPMNRAMLWGATFLASLPVLSYGIGVLQGGAALNVTTALTPLLLSLPGWGGCAFGWICYAFSYIVLNEQGVEHYSPFGHSKLTWKEITALSWTDYTQTIVAPHRTLRLGPVGNNELLMVQARRFAPHAEIRDWPAREKLPK